MIKSIIVSLRPKHWIKNLFVFLPVLFSGSLFRAGSFADVCASFIIFSLASCSVYLLNDILDRKEDRAHPVKSKRPVAQGIISVRLGLFLSSLFFFLAFMASLFKGKYLILIIISYAALNIVYTLFIKHIPILDVIAIALGFELRVWAGALAIGIQPSIWLESCTFLLALFLGFAKRRGEIVLLGPGAGQHRRVLVEYRGLLLDEFITIASGLTLLAYIIYAISRATYMVYTVPFAIYGILRYLYIIHNNRESGDPTEILVSDKPLLADLALWVISILFILYL